MCTDADRGTWIKLTLQLGSLRFAHLFFVNNSALDASILKISVPIIKRISLRLQNTPNLQSLDDFQPSYGNLKKIKVS